jgi:hypothetical protein
VEIERSFGAIRASSLIAGYLEAKYGHTADVHGNCEAGDENRLEMAECHRTWATHGQTITLTSVGKGAKLYILNLFYKPIAADL